MFLLVGKQCVMVTDFNRIAPELSIRNAVQAAYKREQ